jgi:hypothetical protein
LYVLKSSPGRDLIFDVAENMPHLAGFSISGTGKFSEPDDKGIETVEDVVSLQSIDFVGHPATTSSVWEQYHNNNQQKIMTNEEEEKMKEQFFNDLKPKTKNW